MLKRIISSLTWRSEEKRLEREKREDAMLAFWDACKAQDARLATTEHLWRRPGSPTTKERHAASTDT
jgi:hypothetical protein